MFLQACRENFVDFSVFRAYRYAHRGLHQLNAGIPENTLPAFARAVEHGFGAELDVHLTADGHLVVLHDDDLRRLCGAEKKTAALRRADFAAYPILGTQLHAPFLEEVLPLFSHKTPLIVEIKTDGGNAAAVTEAACRILDQFPVTYCMESFDPRVLLYLRKHRPEICRGQLSCDFSQESVSLPRPLLFALSRLWGNCLTRPDFIAYRFEDRGCRALQRCLQTYRVQEFSWTIRSPQDLARAEQAGAIPIFEGFLPSGKRP